MSAALGAACDLPGSAMLPPPRFRSSTVSVVKRRRSRLCRILAVAVPTCVIIALQIHAAGHFEESIELEASAHGRRMAAEASRHVNHASPPAPRASAANGSAQCSRRRRPYHVLVPCSLSVEHQWQARLSYHRYLRLKESDPCSDLGAILSRPPLPARLLEPSPEPLGTFLQAASRGCSPRPTASPTSWRPRCRPWSRAS